MRRFAPYMSFLVLVCAVVVCNTTDDKPPGASEIPFDARFNLEKLLGFLEDVNPKIRNEAAYHLVFLGPVLKMMDPREAKIVVPALARRLNDEDPEIRAYLARTLCWLGALAAPAVPSLAALMNDKEVSVRRVAAMALESIGPGAKPASPTLVRALSDDDQYVRLYSAVTLAKLGVGGDRPWRLIIEAFDSKDDEFASAAVRGAGEMGPDAIPVFTNALQDPRPSVRLAATGALAGIAWALKQQNGVFPESGVEALKKSLKDPDKDVAGNAIYALSIPGKQAKAAVPAIIQCLEDADWSVRYHAARHLWEFGFESTQAIPALEKCLNDPEERVRTEASRSLATILKLYGGRE